MSSTQRSVGTSSIRKLQPQAKLPSRAVLTRLSAQDRPELERRLAERAECIFDARFQQPDAENLLLGPLPATPGVQASSDDSGIDLLAGITGRALTTEQEQHLFLRFNYCRYRVMRVLREFHGKRLSAAAARELLHWERCTTRIRGDIVRLNVALVLAMARRTKLSGVDHADLVSEGNLALLRSVDKFDCSRGFKFSTYACRAILKSFSRVATRTARYRGHFPTEFDPTLEKGDQIEQKRQDVEEDCVDELKAILGRNLAHLSETEQRVIRARIRDGLFDDAPIWDDARTFDGVPWRGLVDVISAGFPCQPFSVAGKRRGEDDPRNLWPDTLRIIREVRPSYAFLENVPGLLAGHGYFGRILGDLAEAGFDAEWIVLSAADAGANHLRKRLWILAYSTELLIRQEPLAGADGTRHSGAGALPGEGAVLAHATDGGRQEDGQTAQAQAGQANERSGDAGVLPDGPGGRSHVPDAQGTGGPAESESRIGQRETDADGDGSQGAVGDAEGIALPIHGGSNDG